MSTRQEETMTQLTNQLPEDVAKAEQALAMAVDDIRDAYGHACSENPVAAMVLFGILEHARPALIQLRELAQHVKEG